MAPSNLRLILASGSPRRRELLAEAGLSFDVVIPDMVETVLPDEAPAELVVRLAQEKARSLRQGLPEAAILAADTVVALGLRILGKPGDPDEARAMLRTLGAPAGSPSWHEVWTGVCLAAPGEEDAFAVRTRVAFRPLDDEEIDRYVATGEPLDKAGAYGIQGRAAGFVLAIEGSYTNVVGLPLAETLLALRRVGITPPHPR